MDYFTLQQLADFLECSKRTVQRMIQLGQGPPAIRLGRRRLFARASVTEWLRSKEHLPRSEKKDLPQLDIVAALRELEADGENSAARRLLYKCCEWVFAHPDTNHPWWAHHIQQEQIVPAGVKASLGKGIGWHTFRHTYSSMLRHLGVDVKGSARAAEARPTSGRP